ncbi:MAG: 30S ribosomal protein S8e [Candidatus Micrarchaeota archaeon]|nr:30S ribosomal protein S8e [Candidatus Micrarchaeota archaeon]
MSQFGSQYHGRSSRKLKGNGKKRLKNRDKKRHEMGGYFTATKLSEQNAVKSTRGRGGGTEDKLQYAGYANLLSGKTYKRVKIKSILESKDNRNFARLNIITKGTVIDTEDGKAIVTNRPGREGFINAVKA